MPAGKKDLTEFPKAWQGTWTSHVNGAEAAGEDEIMVILADRIKGDPRSDDLVLGKNCTLRKLGRRLVLSLPQEEGGLAVIDFQDAVVGPVTYDLVSLLRDCYVRWPREQVRHWVLAHRDALQARGMLGDVDAQRFLHLAKLFSLFFPPAVEKNEH